MGTATQAPTTFKRGDQVRLTVAPPFTSDKYLGQVAEITEVALDEIWLKPLPGQVWPTGHVGGIYTYKERLEPVSAAQVGDTVRVTRTRVETVVEGVLVYDGTCIKGKPLVKVRPEDAAYASVLDSCAVDGPYDVELIARKTVKVPVWVTGDVILTQGRTYVRTNSGRWNGDQDLMRASSEINDLAKQGAVTHLVRCGLPVTASSSALASHNLIAV